MTRQDLKMYICILNIVVKENLVIIVIECLYNTFKKCQDQNRNPNTYVEKNTYKSKKIKTLKKNLPDQE